MPKDKQNTVDFNRVITKKIDRYVMTVPKVLIDKLDNEKEISGKFTIKKIDDKINMSMDVGKS